MLLTCHARCSVEEIVKALDLEMKDLFSRYGCGHGYGGRKHQGRRGREVEYALRRTTIEFENLG